MDFNMITIPPSLKQLPLSPAVGADGQPGERAVIGSSTSQRAPDVFRVKRFV